MSVANIESGDLITIKVALTKFAESSQSVEAKVNHNLAISKQKITQRKRFWHSQVSQKQNQVQHAKRALLRCQQQMKSSQSYYSCRNLEQNLEKSRRELNLAKRKLDIVNKSLRKLSKLEEDTRRAVTQIRQTQKLADSACTQLVKIQIDVNQYTENSTTSSSPKDYYGKSMINAKRGGNNIQLSDPELQTKYPDGVNFNEYGEPDFYPYILKNADGKKLEVEFPEGFSGNRVKDRKTANALAGFGDLGSKASPLPNSVWHHCNDRFTMQLIPRDLHDAVKHTGGHSLNKQYPILESEITLIKLVEEKYNFNKDS